MLAETVLEPGDELPYGWPSFSTYEFMANLMRARSVQVPLKDFTFDLDAIAEAVTPKTKMVIICNPNNPTGTVVDAASVERFLDRMRDEVLVVLDEAYAEYVHDFDYPDSRKLILEGRNVISLRTFSKAYGLAGARIGYSVARPALTEAVNKVRQPFNVSSIAQAGALAALADQEHLRASVQFADRGRAQLYEAFAVMGLAYVPSWTNFVLVDIGIDAACAFEELLRRGVIVRPQTACGLLPTHLRVTVGTARRTGRSSGHSRTCSRRRGRGSALHGARRTLYAPNHGLLRAYQALDVRSEYRLPQGEAGVEVVVVGSEFGLQGEALKHG
ncbi:MAG: aminotransferase class I/II-fold pyridoxal phosphate-dependent enzyme [Actinobacteria bacterium]|nr:aminotransferase class I/II-fold pyridoxal phosphate-dependent enzyme [Actinomycetota bacterium]